MAVTAASLEILFKSDTRQAEAGFDRLNNKVTGFAGTMKHALGTGIGVLGAAGVQAMVGGVGQLVDGALAFGQEMANVNSIMQGTDAQIAGISDEVNAMAVRVGQMPKDLASGLYDIMSSGVTDQAQALDILDVAARGATAGLTTTDVSAAALMSTLNSGIRDLNGNVPTAQQAMDVWFKTVDQGVLTFPELANNIGQAQAAGVALGISQEEIAASYALMTRNGINASETQTRITSLFRAAANPTDALTEAVGDYGFATVQAMIDAEGMPGLLKAIALEANGDTQALYDMLGTQEAVTAAQILGLDSGEQYVEMLGEMEGAAGATDKALSKQMRSASFAMRQARIAVQQAATVFIGALSPAISAVAQGFTGLVTNGLIPAVEWFGDVIDVGGRFVSLMREVFGSGQGVEDLFNVLFGPGASFAGAPDLIKDVARELLNISDAIGDVVAAFRVGGLEGVADVIGEEISNVIDSLGTIAGGVVDVVIDTAVDLIGDIKVLAEKGWQAFVSYAGYGNEAMDPTNATASLEPFDTVDVLIGGAVKLAGDLDDIVGAIERELGLQRGEMDLQGAEQAGYDTGQAIIGAVLQGIDRAVLEAGGVEGGEGPWDGLIKTLEWKDALDDSATLVIAAEAFAFAVGVGTAVSDAVDTGLLISEFVIGAQTAAWNRDIIAAFEDIELSDITSPDLPDWITTPAKFLTPFDEFAKALELTADLLRSAWGSLRSAVGLGQDIDTPGTGVTGPITQGPPPGINFFDLGREGHQFRPGDAPAFAEPFEVPIEVELVPHYTWATPEGEAFLPWGMGGDRPTGGFIGPTFSRTFQTFVDVEAIPKLTNADLPGDVMAMVQGAIGGVGGGVSAAGMMGIKGGGAASITAPVTAELDLDSSAFDTKMATAQSVADAWDIATFMSAFDVDLTAMWAAADTAWQIGGAWDTAVFSASFSVDTSGLDAAVAHAANAAQQIRDLMPSSPAKKGPLSTPISFDYIADELRGAMDRMVPTAERGMGALAAYLNRGGAIGLNGVYGSDSGSGGSAGGDISVTINAPIQGPIYGIDDFENKVDNLFVGKIMPAIAEMKRRQDRARGMSS